MASTQGFNFQQALSGLEAASRTLDVIGNNIANAGTVGFKRSTVAFNDVYSNSVASSSTNPVGMGVKVQSISKTFTQGNLSTTNNPLDVAINGEGFFRVISPTDANTALYTRAGQFRLDSEGFLVTVGGERLTGYPASANFSPTNPTQVRPLPEALRINTAEGPPSATGRLSGQFNLDARAPVFGADAAPFDRNNPNTFSGTSSATVYDSLGNPHVFNVYFRRIESAGESASTWEMHYSVDDRPAAATPFTVSFGADGQVVAPAGGLAPFAVTFSQEDLGNSAAELAFDFSLDDTTQFASNFSANAFAQDGFASGRLASFSIEQNGLIVGRYSNGISRPIGQIALTHFRNPEGLRPITGNLFVATIDSGEPNSGPPGNGPRGTLQSGAIEESNVNLTEELVRLISAQRFYQANTKTIQAQSEATQSMINLR